ncbi:MAG TPA: NAD-dependent epimerase/dehydratase family protein [Acidimicrobiales bacterium]
MEILVTGGNGFLGHNLVSALQDRGYSTRVLALDAEDTTWLQERNVAVYRGNILDPNTLRTPFDGVDAVFHLAAMIGVWRPMSDYFAVNVRGTENVCRAAMGTGVGRLIHVSSAMVYETSGDRPATESDPLSPLDEPYSLTKAQGDELVRRLVLDEGLPATVIRPGTLIGPGDQLNFGRMADRIRSGKGVVIGSGANALLLFDVADMVRGLLLALESAGALGNVYNLGPDVPINQIEYLSIIADECGVNVPRRHVPYAALYAAAGIAERVARITNNRIRPFVTRHGVKLYGANNWISIAKAQAELGFEPQVRADDAVRTACRWYFDRDTASGSHAVAGIRTGLES